MMVKFGLALNWIVTMNKKSKSFTQRIYPNIGQAKRGNSWVNIDVVSQRYFITDKGEKIKYKDCTELRMTPRFMHYFMPTSIHLGGLTTAEFNFQEWDKKYE